MKLNTRTRSIYAFVLAFVMVVTAMPGAVFAQGAAPAADYSAALAAIEEKLEARRKELGIPGMSLAIVKDDKVIYSKGLGYKDFEKKVAVTPNTQFAIGSATKAFTALSVLMTADEGKLSLDASPRTVLPYFKMADPETDKNITIRDLLTHSSGLNRTDLAMITGRLTRQELIKVAGEAKPIAKHRESFGYQNLMYTAAGEVVAVAQGKEWEKFIPERILRPLGMTTSTMTIEQMEKVADRSFGYNYNFDTKETIRLPYREIKQVAPAGSINSSSNEMAEWLRFVLAGGVHNGKRLISEKSFEEWMKPQTKITPNGSVSYALGWFVRDWNGMKVVEHGGNIDGFNALVAMIPEKKLGFVMLTNVSGSSLGNELMPIVWENILGKPEGAKPADKPGQPAAGGAVPADLVGKYLTPNGEGTIEIKEVAGKISLVVPGQQPYALAPKTDGKFAMTPLPDSFSMSVKRDAGKQVEAIVLDQPQGSFTFTRVKGDAAPADLPSIDELMAKVIEAYGGEANIRKYKTRVTTSTINFENQGVSGTGTSWTKAPTMSASEFTMSAAGKVIAKGYDFFDGTRGEESYTFAPSEVMTGKKLENRRIDSDFYSPLNWKTNYDKASVLRKTKCGEEECYVVEFDSEKGTKTTDYFSTKTYLTVRRDSLMPSSTSSQQLPLTTNFEDYRSVDGIMIPFRIIQNSPSNGRVVVQIRDVKHDAKVSDKVFKTRKLKF